MTSPSPSPRPMKAWNKVWSLDDLARLSLFPTIASPKINGERVMIVDGTARSSSGKLIPNVVVQQKLGHPLLSGLDGEIIAGSDPCNPTLRRKTRTVTGSHHCSEPFTFWVFDRWNRGRIPFTEIMASHMAPRNYYGLPQDRNLGDGSSIAPVIQHYCYTVEDVKTLESYYVALGYEGLILRSPSQPYKHGRCTWKEFEAGRGMLKLKRFATGTALVLRVIPLVDEAILGSLEVKGLSPPYTGSIFRIGKAVAGRWNEDERYRLMRDAAYLPGKRISYRHLPDGTYFDEWL